MTMMSAGVHASARAAARPPKPAPTMTTLGRRGGAWEGVAAAAIGDLPVVPAQLQATSSMNAATRGSVTSRRSRGRISCRRITRIAALNTRLVQASLNNVPPS